MKIFRCDYSPYQSTNFVLREKVELRSIGLEYIEDQKKASILITNTSTKIEELNLENTKLIIHPNSGYDNFPLHFVKDMPFPIVIGGEIRSSAVYEYILSCIFHRYKINFQKDWNRSPFDRPLLKDQEVLLIGLGNIGQKVKNSLRSMTKKIHVLDPYVEGSKKSLNEIPIERCSIIILCCGLNKTSQYIIDSNFLTLVPKNTTIINPARGKLINQKDLISFLKRFPDSSAYLDVFEKEPSNFSTLNLKNIYLTSHIAGFFNQLDESIINFEKKILKDYLTKTSEFSTMHRNSILKNRIHDNILI